jgi:ABC-type sugar transport system ATPase subunit
MTTTQIKPAEFEKGFMEMRDISMEFPGVKALNHVNFKARPGEILALMGENGAGKSTLMKVLSGVIPYPEYSGTILLDGEEQKFKSTKDARGKGIAIIHQELNLFPELSVSENMFLTMEPTSLPGIIDERARDRKARRWLRDIGIEVDVRTPVKELSVGNQQLIEILRALATNANVLIFDEPTSALSLVESETLFRILGELRSRGHTIIYISHRMEEVFRLADRIVVLRDGQTVGEGTKDELNPGKVVSMMVGRAIDQLYPKRSPQLGDEAFRVEHLSVRPRGPSEPEVKDVSFAVRAGEILGIAGLVGSGRTELISAIFGAASRGRVSGGIWVNGKKTHVYSPNDAIDRGLALVTEDRKFSGLVLNRSVAENMTLAALARISPFNVINRHRAHGIVTDYIRKLRIKTPNPEVEVRTLSGGNQQKIVLAKWLAIGPRVLFLDEPTRGIDVGSRQEIYQLIDMLANEGVAIVMVSSDLPEVLGMSDRVLVMRDGHVAGELAKGEANQESVMRYAAGVG